MCCCAAAAQVWDLSEGRQPCNSTLPLPIMELNDLDSGVWAVSASVSGQLLVTGTEEGTVAAWDLRTRQQIWATQVSIANIATCTTADLHHHLHNSALQLAAAGLGITVIRSLRCQQLNQLLPTYWCNWLQSGAMCCPVRGCALFRLFSFACIQRASCQVNCALQHVGLGTTEQLVRKRDWCHRQCYVARMPHHWNARSS